MEETLKFGAARRERFADGRCVTIVSPTEMSETANTLLAL
jgi:hypothetical protein